MRSLTESAAVTRWGVSAHDNARSRWVVDAAREAACVQPVLVEVAFLQSSSGIGTVERRTFVRYLGRNTSTVVHLTPPDGYAARVPCRAALTVKCPADAYLGVAGEEERNRGYEVSSGGLAVFVGRGEFGMKG